MTPEQLIPIIVKVLRETQRPWGRKDLWLAQMVVGMVQQKAKEHKRRGCRGGMAESLFDFSLTPEDWTWLKEKVGE